MTLELALLITSDGIALAHRQRAGHWSVIGDTAFDVPDLNKAMGKLRKLGEARAGKGFATLLVLPDDQILYTSLTAPTGDPEITAFRIEEGLDGLTPYAVSELEYDWRAIETDRIKLAVVAQETLGEARAFAKAHKMNPAGFAAMPPQERFPGTPLFDLSGNAKGLSFPEDGLAFGPDDWATGGDTDNAAENDDGSAPTTDASQEDGEEKPAQDGEQTGGDPSDAAKTDRQPTAESDVEADAAAENVATTESDAPGIEVSNGETATTEAEPKPEGDTSNEAAPAGAEDDLASEEGDDGPETDRDPEEVLAAAAVAPEQGSATALESGDLQQIPSDPALTAPVEPLENETGDRDHSSTLSSAVTAARNASAAMDSDVEESDAQAFSARGDRVPARDDQDAPNQVPPNVAPSELTDTDEASGAVTKNPLAERLSRVREASRPNAAQASPASEDGLKPAPRRGETAAARPVLPPSRGKSGEQTSRKGRLTSLVSATDGTSMQPDTAGEGTGGLGARIGGLIGRATRGQSAEAKPVLREVTSATPAPKLTGSGRLSALSAALNSDEDSPSPRQDSAGLKSVDDGATDSNITDGLLGRKTEGGPGRSLRTGLLLTIVLLILLAAIAVWSALFLPDSPVARLFSGDRESAAAERLDAPAPPAAITAPPAIGELAIPDLPPATQVEDARPAPPEPAPPAVAETDPEPTVPANEVASVPPVAPLAPLPEDALPSLEEAQALYDTYQLWPRTPDRPDLAPLDTLSDLGLSSADPAVASLDAIALPRPDLDPAESISRIAPPPPFGTRAPAVVADATPATPEGTVTEAGVRVTAGPPPVTAFRRPEVASLPAPVPTFSIEDAILGTFRPAPRPGDLGEAPADAGPLPVARTQRALLTPQPRSQPSAAAAPAAAATASAASLFPGSTAQPTGPEDAAASAAASGSAVARSIVPAARPADMATLVANATPRQPIPPAAIVEPAAIAPGPQIPSNASVARAATQDNVLRLRQVNLIGVTGTNSERRALVRLPSGRFVRVAVGDRLDGGRVAAIGESTLQYVRSGRTVTLDIPG